MTVKNVRSKMTEMMMQRVYDRSLGGQAVDEIMMDIAQDEKTPLELRFKAAAKVADLIFPRAQSVEVDVEVQGFDTGAQIDDRIKELLSMVAPGNGPGIN